MATFQFRLQAKLNLTHRDLEDAQKELANEIKKWQEALTLYQDQQNRLDEAVAGQRHACRFTPQAIGLWQLYVRDQLERLRQCQRNLEERDEALARSRARVLKAHQETEKFQRLKDKQLKEFLVIEQQKEQAELDEIGQRVYHEFLKQVGG